jgi:hypothetical protein
MTKPDERKRPMDEIEIIPLPATPAPEEGIEPAWVRERASAAGGEKGQEQPETD